MATKKILNDPFDAVDEMLDGILKAHPGHLRRAGETGRALVRAGAPVPQKVGIVTGGGAGHLPLFLGYVGQGLADGAAVGNVFSSPGPAPMYDCIKAVDAGRGVLQIFGNYQGDVMNFQAAAEMARADGIQVAAVIGNDDVASAPREQAHNRRGVAGLYYALRLAGAKAAEGASFEEVKRTAEAVIANTRTMGVALSPCTVPAAGRPTFEIADDEMEIGMGIHGEPGLERTKLQSADQLAEALLAEIGADLPLREGDQVSVLVNGLGATPPTELYVLFRRVHDLLTAQGVAVHKAFVGEYATSLEMAGCSVSVLRLTPEFKRLLGAPIHSPFLLHN
ncbi:dihydroxyacetone kinase subunit DhaK [Ramlibacter sp.]|uniref:dihydroxyacetone kinase subunit DhaK n=1 Tax=Ramlibacter sp. TaxID=1917967 RepID=UPI002FCACCAB